MTGFISDSTLTGLHYHKVGQHASFKKVFAMNVSALIMVAVVSLVIGFSKDGGGHAPGERTLLLNLSQATSSGALPPSGSTEFPTGYVGKIRVVPLPRDPVLPLRGLPESSLSSLGVPAVYDFPHGGIGMPLEPMSCTTDFGLPDPPPFWTYHYRSSARVNTDRDISLPIIGRKPHAMLVNPAWPENVWLVDDTAIVDGILTMHSYGLMSFELISETPSKKGFGLAVKRAVERSQCIPARDNNDNRITVRCQYRVLFFHGGQPSISVGTAVTARVRKGPR